MPALAWVLGAVVWAEAGLVEGRGACRHPDGAAQLARSLLRAFPEHTRQHERRGSCGGVRRPALLPLPGDDERDWDFT